MLTKDIRSCRLSQYGEILHPDFRFQQKYLKDFGYTYAEAAERAADYVNKRDILPSPLPGLLKRLFSILGLRAALRCFTPGYCSFSASGATKHAALAESPALPG
jgi:hypothetical protein